MLIFLILVFLFHIIPSIIYYKVITEYEKLDKLDKEILATMLLAGIIFIPSFIAYAIYYFSERYITRVTKKLKSNYQNRKQIKMEIARIKKEIKILKLGWANDALYNQDENFDHYYKIITLKEKELKNLNNNKVLATNSKSFFKSIILKKD